MKRDLYKVQLGALIRLPEEHSDSGAFHGEFVPQVAESQPALLSELEGALKHDRHFAEVLLNGAVNEEFHFSKLVQPLECPEIHRLGDFS